MTLFCSVLLLKYETSKFKMYASRDALREAFPDWEHQIGQLGNWAILTD